MMPRMFISFNYLISVCAYVSCFILHKKGELYNNAARFMFFLATAALLGGFVHHMELDKDILISLINIVNSHLPAFLEPLDFDKIDNRLWFITIECIGITEFYFMYLFIDPLMHGSLNFIKTWLKAALFIYFIVTLLSTQYFYVVAFHVFSHTVIIIFSLIMYFIKGIKPLLLLAFLALYNLSIGIMQQLMSDGVIPTGPFNYNDWYHLGVIIFVIAMHLLFTKGRLIETLDTYNK